MTRRRIEKGNFKRKVDYGFASALTHQPKLARILRDWDTDLMIKFVTNFLNDHAEK